MLAGGFVERSIAEDAGSKDRRRQKFAMLAAAANLSPGEGVAWCCRGVAFNAPRDRAGERYAVIYQGRQRAFLRHLRLCGSPWACPVCAARISEQRRSEIAHVMHEHIAAGGSVWMSTFTIPHYGYNDPKKLRKAVAAAYQKLTNNRASKQRKEQCGMKGFVRALEVTHGVHGWHPHLHVLWFLDCHPRIAQEFGDWLQRHWRHVIGAIGAGEVSDRAPHFRYCTDPGEAGDYVAKWGADWEMTKGRLKVARSGRNRAPWQILQDYTGDGWPPDGELFQQYHRAFKGAKQLTWSRGLRELYALPIMEDQDAAELLAADEAKPIAAISASAVQQLRERQLFVDFLEAAESGSYWAAVDFMARWHVVGAIRPPDGLEFQDPDHAKWG